MPHRSDERTGARIARARAARHLTQRELAGLAAVPHSTVTRIERGLMPVSPAVTGALARALSVPVTELTGQPYLDDLRRDQLDGLIQPVREALDGYDLGADPGVTPRPLPELRVHADQLCALVRAAQLTKAAGLLPGLITETTASAHLMPTRQAWQTLASAYRTACDITAKLGYQDLCAVALDRMEWAAQRASDAVLAGVRQYLRALHCLRAADYRTGQRVVRAGLATLQQAELGRERDAATGQLHLGAAVLYARLGDGAACEDHLAEAQRLAQRTGPAEQVHWLSFGPANVDVHRVAALAERERYDEAVSAADSLTLPAGWPRSRTARHHAEVARAQLWTGQTDAAFRSLLRAKKAGPEQMRYHPLVRETYAGLDAARRQVPGSFAAFGDWLGI